MTPAGKQLLSGLALAAALAAGVTAARPARSATLVVTENKPFDFRKLERLPARVRMATANNEADCQFPAGTRVAGLKAYFARQDVRVEEGQDARFGPYLAFYYQPRRLSPVAPRWALVFHLNADRTKVADHTVSRKLTGL